MLTCHFVIMPAKSSNFCKNIKFWSADMTTVCVKHHGYMRYFPYVNASLIGPTALFLVYYGNGDHYDQSNFVKRTRTEVCIFWWRSTLLGLWENGKKIYFSTHLTTVTVLSIKNAASSIGIKLFQKVLALLVSI